MRYLSPLTLLLLHGVLSPPPVHAAEPLDGVVIHEIELGASAWIELFNGGVDAADLTGWQLHLFDGSGWNEVYTFPAFILPGGAYAVLHEGGSAADDTALELHTGWEIPWSNAGSGAAELLTASLGPADYVEFGQGVPVDPVHDESWTGSYGAVVPDAGKTVGREPGLADSDGFGDWCGQEATPGAANDACACSQMLLGGLVVDTVIWDTWSQEDLDATWPDGSAEACNSFTLSQSSTAYPPFSLEPGVTFRVFAGKRVVFNSGTWIPSGASLVVGVDPQLRQ